MSTRTAPATAIRISSDVHATISRLQQHAQAREEHLKRQPGELAPDAMNRARQAMFEVEAASLELEDDAEKLGLPRLEPRSVGADQFEKLAQVAVELQRPEAHERAMARAISRTSADILEAMRAAPGDSVSVAQLGALAGKVGMLKIWTDQLGRYPSGTIALESRASLDSLSAALERASAERSPSTPAYFVVEAPVH